MTQFFLYSVFFIFISLSSFLISSSGSKHITDINTRKQTPSPDSLQQSTSSLIFPVSGNVYPDGYYHAELKIGNPPKPYHLDIDSGSDLTWLQCDAPCENCTPAPHEPYKPRKDVLIKCVDPVCATVNSHANQPCDNQEEQCDYQVEYADQGVSMGVLVKDVFPLRFAIGDVHDPHLVFGCGYNQEFPNSVHPPYTDGVLGLSKGKLSIVSQLHDLGLVQNLMGHCLSTKGDGFLFIGDDGVVPSSGVSWLPNLSNSLDEHYRIGPADLLYGRKSTGVKGIPLVLDSGSTYSYFTSDAYGATLSMLKKDVKKLKDAEDDGSLPVCWRGSKPFKSINDVDKYFKPIVLSFPKAKHAQIEVPPEAYLIISEHGNACFGMLNGSEVGLGNFNIIGNNFLLDKMIIYDNENQRIGSISSNCHSLPRNEEQSSYLADEL
ncbi:aspartic proteinase Asp1-like isoform X2 [Impatiens glandulifera]|uniref:aspartic proteinase Asp1-like isoform X2 n=1 Tax=Impatiens glandulifera TaxID=253017 RepID=UPI001FB09885|nr:aspartic proteinase Asp1-like isoform X2 [Impatiens glandulifera]